MNREEGIAVFDAIVGLGGTPYLCWEPNLGQYSVSILDRRIEHSTLEAILSVTKSAGGSVVYNSDRLEVR